jgi:serine/threonine protein kinase
MTDTRTTTRGPVPIALGSGAGDTEEGRGFFQDRLALFGRWIFLLSGGFYIVYRITNFFIPPQLDVTQVPVGDPNHYHLYATLVAGALWAVARSRKRLSTQVVEWLDATSSLLMCALFAVMAVGFGQIHLAVAQDPMHGLLTGVMACGYVLLSRAVAVPSTPGRTLVVSSVAILPMAVAGWFVLVGAEVPGIDLSSTVIDVITWCLAAIFMSAVASRVTFGLRAEVDQVRRLGQYTLQGKLGEGGMGIVYQASHALLRRPTAIKILRPEVAGEDALRRFEREVQLTSSLNHPSTVVIFDYGRTPQGMFYYAMEYLDGLSLEELVRIDGPQPPARVVHILRQVAGALAEAHDVGLIHRDIKPANIIVSKRGGMADVAKVVDFGLVKSFEPTSPTAEIDVTSAHVLVGTPLYMAPEAISGAATLDGRSDLYALGAVGYFLLTGTPVFTAKSLVEVFAHHLHTPPESPSVRAGYQMPENLEQLILRCLAKQPDQRYDDARALLRALDGCAEHLPWVDDLALQWWAALDTERSSRSPDPSPPDAGPQTITVDVSGRVSRC